MFNAIGNWISNLLGGGAAKQSSSSPQRPSSSSQGSGARDDEEERRRRLAAQQAAQAKTAEQNKTLPEFAKPKNQPQAQDQFIPQYQAIQQNPSAPLKTVDWQNPTPNQAANEPLVKAFKANPQMAQAANDKHLADNLSQGQQNTLRQQVATQGPLTDEQRKAWNSLAASNIKQNDQAANSLVFNQFAKGMTQATNGLMALPGFVGNLTGIRDGDGNRIGDNYMDWYKGNLGGARLDELEAGYDKDSNRSIDTLVQNTGELSTPLAVTAAVANAGGNLIDPLLGLGAYGASVRLASKMRRTTGIAEELADTAETAARTTSELAAQRVAQIEREAPSIIQQVEREAGKVDDGISSPTRGKPAAQQAADQLRLQQQQLAEQAAQAQAQAQAARQAQAAEQAQSLAPYVQPEQVSNGLNQLSPEPVMLRKAPAPIDDVQLQKAEAPKPTEAAPKPETAPIESPNTAKSKTAAQTTPVAPDVVPGTNKTQAELDGMARALLDNGDALNAADAKAMAMKMARRQAKEAEGVTQAAPEAPVASVKTKTPADMSDAEILERFGDGTKTADEIRAGFKTVEKPTPTPTPTKVMEKTTTKPDTKPSSKSVLEGGDRAPTMKEVQDALKNAATKAEKKPLNRLKHALANGDERHLANVLADINGAPKPEKAPAIANPARTAERQDRRLGKAVDDIKAEMKAASKAGEDTTALAEKKSLLNRIKYKLQKGDRTDLDALKKANPETFDELGIKYRKGTDVAPTKDALDADLVDTYMARHGKAPENGKLKVTDIGGDFGRYHHKTGIIEINKDIPLSEQNFTLNHESVHKAIAESLTRDEVSELLSAVNNRMKAASTTADDVLKKAHGQDYSDASKAVQNEEYMAELFGKYARTMDEWGQNVKGAGARMVKDDIKVSNDIRRIERTRAAEKMLIKEGFSAKTAKVVAGLFDKVLAGISKAKEAVRTALGKKAAAADYAKIDKFFDDLYNGKFKNETPVAGSRAEAVRAGDNTAWDTPLLRKNKMEGTPVKAKKFAKAAEVSGKKRGANANLQQTYTPTVHKELEAQVHTEFKGATTVRQVRKLIDHIPTTGATTPLDGVRLAKAADILSSLSAKGVKSAGKAYEDAASRIIEAANNSGQFMSGMRAVYKMMPSEWHVAKEFDKIKDGLKKQGIEDWNVSKKDKQKMVEHYSSLRDTQAELEQTNEAIRMALHDGTSNADQLKMVEKADALKAQFREQDLAYKRHLNSILPKMNASQRALYAYQHFPDAVDTFRRYAMLSGLTGRVRDFMSTGFNAAHWAGSTALESGMGKAMNAANAMTGNKSRYMSKIGINQVVLKKSMGELGGDIKSRWRNEADSATLTRMQDLSAGNMVKKDSHLFQRGTIKEDRNVLRKLPGGLIRIGTGAPTSASIVMKNAELYRTGLRDAMENGMKGEAARDYAERFMYANSTGEYINIKGSPEYNATQEWLAASGMHENVGSKMLTGMVKSLSDGEWVQSLPKSVQPVVRTVSHGLATSIAPFANYMGGNLHNILTRYNPIWEGLAAMKNVKNPQIAAKHLSRALTSSAGIAIGYGLLSNGTIALTDEDAQGNKYGGLQLKFGAYHIPVSNLGGAATSILIALNSTIAAQREGSLDLPAAFMTGLSQAGHASGLEDVAGGNNMVSQLLTSVDSSDGSSINGLKNLAGDQASMFIPAISRDATNWTSNAKGIELAPDTNISTLNTETGRLNKDYGKTVMAKLASGVPGLADTLPRKTGDNDIQSTPMQSPTARLFGATTQSQAKVAFEAKYGNDSQAKAAAGTNASSMWKSTKNPDNALVSKQRDTGDWDGYIKSMNMKNDLRKRDESPDDTAARQRKITQATVAKENKYTGEDVKMYEKIGQDTFKKLINPKSDEYDMDLAQKLWAIDVAMTKAGASAKTGGYQPWLKQKYTNPKAQKSGSGGGRGGKQSYSSSFSSVYKPSASNGNFDAPSKATVAQLPKIVAGNPMPTKFKKNISAKKGVHL